MKKIIQILSSLCLFVNFAFSQTIKDYIYTKKAFGGGFHFYQNGNKLKVKKVVEIMKPNKAAYEEILLVQEANTASKLLSFAGGFLIGWQIGNLTSPGGKIKMGVIGAGAAIIAITIPINQKIKKRSNNAMALFNTGLPYAFLKSKKTLNFYTSGNGLGFALKF